MVLAGFQCERGLAPLAGETPRDGSLSDDGDDGVLRSEYGDIGMLINSIDSWGVGLE